MFQLHGRRPLAALILAVLAAPLWAATGTSLTFDPARFTVKSMDLGGKTITYRAYEGIVYVKNPVDPIQTMNIFVPAEYYEGKAIGTYTLQSAPIFFPNSVGGYMPGPAGSPGQGMEGGPNASLVALSKGYVVAAPGTRGRTNKDAAGTFVGKAPAVIVDLKAAVRYLRFNDKLIPGDSEKIISNGTSAGGAVSALLGATGNNADYEPYLKALGAADARDDIFAVSAYCPITNLENADMAYEWLFAGYNEVKAGPARQGPPPAGATGPWGAPQVQAGPMTAEQIQNSADLKALFPAYLNSLGLKKSDGTVLTLDASGNGSFKDFVKAYVIASAQKALAAGTDLSSKTWITVQNGKVTDINWDGYIQYVGRQKKTSAFDGTDLSTGENDEFGTATVAAQHFTAFGQARTTVPATQADPAVVKMMNPLAYIGAPGTTSSKFWRIRHGSVDRDTSFAIPTILATRLTNAGYQVDFGLPWDRPHSGDYDLDELFAWVETVCQ